MTKDIRKTIYSMNKFKLVQVVLLALFPLNCIAQKMEIYEESGVKYVAINTEGIPRNTEDRSTNSDFYAEVGLYTYSSDGNSSTPILDGEGNPVNVDRVQRHVANSSANKFVSKHFIVSPTDVYSDGTTNGANGGVVKGINWATANGYLATANNNTSGSSATPMGCPVYKGKSGTDAEGTWRVPTLKEAVLIAIFYKEIEETSGETGFQPFMTGSKDYYWLATENSKSDAWSMKFLSETNSNLPVYQITYHGKKDTYYVNYLRCVRDIP